jgi:hypothetical protein
MLRQALVDAAGHIADGGQVLEQELVTLGGSELRLRREQRGRDGVDRGQLVVALQVCGRPAARVGVIAAFGQSACGGVSGEWFVCAHVL